MVNVSRRNFFKSIMELYRTDDSESDSTQGRAVIRPPYCFNEELAKSYCGTCSAPCIERCPEKIIVRAEDNTVTLDFVGSGCTFCEICATSCPHGVLKLSSGKVAINAFAVLSTMKCLSWQNSVCYSCIDSCPIDAIVNYAQPTVQLDICNGCGICIRSCPVEAIEMQGRLKK